MDQTMVAGWHDFYITTATASASLIGLLFVAVSLNLDVVAAESRDDLRAFSEQAFSSFAAVLLVSLFFLIPQQSSSILAFEYVVLGTGAGYRMVRRAPAVWRGRSRDGTGAVVLWRFLLPAVATLGLFVAAALLAEGYAADALYWLVWVVVGLLLSAARSSWDLLIRVGDERKRPG